MVELLTLDPRLPIPDSLTTSDDTHPLNLLKQIREANAQAAKDKEFDPPMPKRLQVKEAFQAERRKQSVFFIMVLGIFVAALYAMTGTFERILQIVLLFVGIAGLLMVYTTYRYRKRIV